MTIQTLTTADATGEEFYVPTSGIYGVSAAGTFGSGTAKLQCKNDGANWFDVANASWTSTGWVIRDLPAGKYRFTLTGSTGAEVTVAVSD